MKNKAFAATALPPASRLVETIPAVLDLTGMRTLTRFSNIGVVAAVLMVPSAILPLRALAQEHREERRENNQRYHDAKHKDDHDWNDHEDQAYRMWNQERHRTYTDFSKLRDRDRQAYWNWRHDHSDAQLKIEVR